MCGACSSGRARLAPWTPGWVSAGALGEGGGEAVGLGAGFDEVAAVGESVETVTTRPKRRHKQRDGSRSDSSSRFSWRLLDFGAVLAAQRAIASTG